MSAQSRVRSNITLKAPKLERPEHGDLRALERNDPSVACGVAVDWRVVEEEVDRRLIPPEPDLAVALDLGFGSSGLLYARGESVERRLRIGGRDEQVDVDVPCPARLSRPEGERDGAAEGVLHPGGLEAAMDLDDALRKGKFGGYRALPVPSGTSRG